MKREYIRQVLDDWDNLKLDGIYFSGAEGEGEFKNWFTNGKLYQHGRYKDWNRDGKWEEWYDNGAQWVSTFYKNGKLEGEYQIWDDNGKLLVHRLFKKGNILKDYLE